MNEKDSTAPRFPLHHNIMLQCITIGTFLTFTSYIGDTHQPGDARMSTTNGLNLTSNFANIARQWPALSALCNDAALFAARGDSVSKWGVAQQTHHCALALAGIARGVEGLIANSQGAGGTSPKHPQADAMLAAGAFPRGVAKSPDFLIPPDAPAAGDTRALLQAAKAGWDALEKRGADITASKATFPHPILGDFNGVQWVRFMGLHTAHHLKIVRDILSASNLKTPYGADVENL